jgi:sn-glycerol 3-phosphate transport system permease protein
MKQHYHSRIKPYLLISPALLLAVLFSYRPFILTLINSLHTISLSGKHLSFIGLENYRRLFANPSFQASLSNTLRFTLFFVPTNIIICLSAALLSNRRGKLATLNQIFFFLPMAVGLSSSMMILKMMFNPSIGIINRLFGLNVQWFNNRHAAMALLVIAGVGLDIGLDFLLFSAALRNVPTDLLEVAQIEGANGRQTFRYLQGPLISSTLLFVVVTNIKDAMLISSPVMILTEGGPFRSTQTLVYQMYLDGFKSGNYAMGSTIATVVFLLTFSVLLLLMRLERRRVYYQ